MSAATSHQNLGLFFFITRSAVLALTCVAVSACTSTHAQLGAKQLREHAAKYYEEQIMDNLIRASNGQFFIHVDLDTLTSAATSKLNGGFNGGQTLKKTNSLAGVTAGVARELTKPLTFALSPERADAITVTADPIVAKPELYLPYIQFLSLKNPDDRLDEVKAKRLLLNRTIVSLESVASSQKLLPADYVPGTLTERDHKTYYVPIRYRQAYADLCLALMNRIPEVKPPAGTKGVGIFETNQEAIKGQLQRTEEQLKKTESKIEELRNLQLLPQ